MLEKILKLYVMATAQDVRSPMPHLFGPPGCGKSSVVEALAALLKVNLHIINVARISPLDVEGVQMPETLDGEEMKLRLLHATFWTQLKEGDIVLLDEFLRGFPEVYNALLDILTSRQVGGLKLPKVFIIAASNSTVAYDKALEDRLLHLPVADPRNNKVAKQELMTRFVDMLGLLPRMAKSIEVRSLIEGEVLPMYEILDSIKGSRGGAAPSLKGQSLRSLIGQAQLRETKCAALIEAIRMNNTEAMMEGKPQFVLLLDGKAGSIPTNYEKQAKALLANDKSRAKLSSQQVLTLQLNLQLIEMESIRNEKGTNTDDDTDIFVDDVDPF